MTKKKGLGDFLTGGSGAAIAIAALVFVIVSLLLFGFAGWLESSWPRTAGALHQTASLLLTVGGIQFLLRTKVWKDAIDSIGDRFQLKEATTASGLTEYWQFDAVPWATLFAEAKEVTIVAISARPILVNRLATVRDFLARKDTKLNLVLADFREGPLMARFDAEMNEAPGTRASKLKEALGELLKVLRDDPNDKVNIHLYTSRVPYSAYQFDHQILFVPYIAEPIRDSRRIPALLFAAGGMVTNYLEPDLAFLRSGKTIPHADLEKMMKE